MSFKDIINSPDKEGKEKHIPVIESPDKVRSDEWFEVTVVIGKDVAHPNTLEHHIEGISLYYKEDGDKLAVKLAEFSPIPVHADSRVTVRVKIGNSGKVHAISSCNIHGIWESEKEIKIN